MQKIRVDLSPDFKENIKSMKNLADAQETAIFHLYKLYKSII